MFKRFWNEFKSYIVAFVAIFALVIAMWMLNIPCSIKYVAGISCAGCGMSRAILSALKFDFASAFAYHPLWFIVIPAVIALVILGANGKKRASTVFLISIGALFLITWIIRIILKDEIVSINLSEGAIAGLFEK